MRALPSLTSMLDLLYAFKHGDLDPIAKSQRYGDTIAVYYCAPAPHHGRIWQFTRHDAVVKRSKIFALCSGHHIATSLGDPIYGDFALGPIEKTVPASRTYSRPTLDCRPPLPLVDCVQCRPRWMASLVGVEDLAQQVCTLLTGCVWKLNHVVKFLQLNIYLTLKQFTGRIRPAYSIRSGASLTEVHLCAVSS